MRQLSTSLIDVSVPQRVPVAYPGIPRLDRDVRHRKTLVVCPIGMGNYIMLTPALQRLSEEIGRENLCLFAPKAGIRELALASGYFGSVYCWDPDKEPKSAGLKTLWNLRRERFDFSVSLFPTVNWRFALFATLSGAKTRIGFVDPNTGLANRLQAFTAPLNTAAHDTDQNCDLIDALIGAPQEARRAARELTFPFAPAHPLAAELQQQDYFVCHPGSSTERGMREKRLPPQEFAAICRLVYREFGTKCVLVGGPEEAALRQEIASRAPEVMLPYTSSNLNELAALISYSRFYVGNDSGLMHVSVALRKRCVVFFGPTDERRNGPYDNHYRDGGPSRHLIVRRDDLLCAPCWNIHTIGANPPCIFGDTRCLREFRIQTVWPRIRRYLETLY